MGLFDGLRRNQKNVAPENKKTIEKSLEESYADSLVSTVDSAPVANEVATQEQPVVEQTAVEPEETQVVDEQPVNQYQDASSIYKTIKPYSEKKPVTHVIGQTRIVSIINQKGGVGKSTTAVNLAAALGEQGRQVLLVDLDPQGNTSSGLGIEKSQIKHCIYDALLNDVPLEQIIIPDVCPGLDLVPATINLAGAEVELVSEIARENRLKEAVGRFRGKYDYIFIDCPPSLGLLTINAFVAADKLLIPIQCEFYALEGVTKLLDSMKRVKTRLNPTLDIYGVLLTMYDGRTILSKQVAAEVRNFFGKIVFETLIPRTVKLSEAPSFGQPITQYDPNGKGAKAYSDLAKEVISRG